jgi:hypothetical protein
MIISSPSFVASQQQRLVESLAAQSDGTVFDCGYGFVLYRREEAEGAVFGIVTPFGESMPLTARLVADLGLHRCRLRGDTQLSLAPVEAYRDLDLPLDEVRIDFYRMHEQRDETVSVGYVARAQEFRHATIMLTEQQPSGWPR